MIDGGGVSVRLHVLCSVCALDQPLQGCVLTVSSTFFNLSLVALFEAYHPSLLACANLILANGLGIETFAQGWRLYTPLSALPALLNACDHVNGNLICCFVAGKPLFEIDAILKGFQPEFPALHSLLTMAHEVCVSESTGGLRMYPTSNMFLQSDEHCPKSGFVQPLICLMFAADDDQLSQLLPAILTGSDESELSVPVLDWGFAAAAEGLEADSAASRYVKY